MTTDPVPSGLQPFSQLKAGPTISSSKSTAVPASPTTTASAQLSRPQQLKNTSREESGNGTSDKATIALIRRVLCPQSGSYGGATSPYAPEELLPPLTSSNDVDRQLYAFIAIIIKEFISPWYSKITSDQALINEILLVIAHSTRALEQRLRETDIAQLALDDIPALVEAHIASFSPVPDPFDVTTVSQQRDNEAVYRRLLVNGVLAVLLPTEDVGNACLRTLVNDILSDLILGNEVSGRVCEGWFLWESTTKLLEVFSRNKGKLEDAAAKTEDSRPTRLQQFGLLSTKDGSDDDSPDTTQSQASHWIWHILQYAFWAYVALRFVVAGLFRIASTPPVILTSRSNPPGSPVDGLAIKYGHKPKRPVLDYRVYGMLSQLLDIPRRMPWLGGLLALFQYLILAGPGRVADSGSVLDRFLRENIEEYVLTPTLLPNLLRASREALFPHNSRPKPEASSRIEVLTSTPTPTLPSLGEGQLPAIDDAQTTAASGGNAITPAPIATALSPDPQSRPSPAEIASIRRKCAIAILSLIPRPIARQLLGIPAATGPGSNSFPGPSPDQSPSQVEAESGARRDRYPLEAQPSNSSALIDGDAEESLLVSTLENDILDLFADEYCNKHLIFSIVETVLAKLLPELSDHSIAELLEDRGVFIPTP
ncbi:PXA domain-containing protein [Aspergillus karnatakaensis]|uniref:PXA domain-containing protein n=1 Tax=Aspergillus karnatakaensis TaxID=1810916 RepID=UPI003CCD6999